MNLITTIPLIKKVSMSGLSFGDSSRLKILKLDRDTLKETMRSSQDQKTILAAKFNLEEIESEIYALELKEAGTASSGSGSGTPEKVEYGVMGAISTISAAASGYHGYKRNNSVGWAIGWFFLGGLFPIITPVIAYAQGFGKPRDDLKK